MAKRVLVVEGEALLALVLKDHLEEVGWSIEGIAHTRGRAEKMAAALDFDIALLDLNLHGASSHSVIDILRSRGRPFVLMTGYDTKDLPVELTAYRVLAVTQLRQADGDTATWRAGLAPMMARMPRPCETTEECIRLCAPKSSRGQT